MAGNLVMPELFCHRRFARLHATRLDARRKAMSQSDRAKRQELRIDGLPAPLSHYTDAVRFGDILFVSGLTAHNSDGKIVGDADAAAQTRQILINLKLVLDAAGATMADVLKVTVFLTDINDRAAINPVRQEFFGAARPASTLIEVSRLALPEMKVEIEAVVGLPAAK
jgi:2-iminobutanoate/2-iminopropanoate deaminase